MTPIRRIAAAIFVALVLLIVLPPLSVRPEGVETALSESLGFPVHVDAVEWSLHPLPALRLKRAALKIDSVASFELNSENVFVHGGLSPDVVELDGFELELGPLELRGGSLRFERNDAGFEAEGRALGKHGGFIELTGGLGRPPEQRSPLRFYLSKLGLPVSSVVQHGSSERFGNVELTGMLTADGLPDEQQDWVVSLDAHGDSTGLRWLDAHISGALRLVQGQFLPSSELEFRGEIRDVEGGEAQRVVHGEFHLVAQIAGDRQAGRMVINADLDELRVRLGEHFDKASGVPGQLRIETYWEAGGPPRSQGTLKLGAVEIHFDHQFDGNASVLDFVSETIDLQMLQAMVPALRDTGATLSGELKALGRWDSDFGWNALAELNRSYFLSSGPPIYIPKLLARMENSRYWAEAPELTWSGEPLAVQIDAEHLSDTTGLRVGIHVETDRLNLNDLQPLARWFDIDLDPNTPIDTEEAAYEMIRVLQSPPNWLEDVELRPLTIAVGNLVGPDIAETNAVFRMEFANQRVRFEHRREQDPIPVRRLALNLNGWIPTIEESF